MSEETIKKVSDLVRAQMEGEGSGHDWWHVNQVWKHAKAIGQKEGSDLFVTELAALLHDIADWKFNDGDEKAGSRKAAEILTALNVEKPTIDHVCEIIDGVSFKGAGVPTPMRTLEGKVVQDADRLEALGAMGIARCFAYGGHKNREIYNPHIKPQNHQSFEEYKKKGLNTSINHFYEKLLLLKDRMNTKTGRELANKRQQFMEEFLARFFKEWDGLA